MGIIVNKENNNDELSRRISADLKNKAMSGVDIEGDTPDLIDDSDYIQDFKKTGRFGWVWVVLIILAVASLISILLI